MFERLARLMTTPHTHGSWLALLALFLALGLTGCASNKEGAALSKAPVEDRGARAGAYGAGAAGSAATPAIATPIIAPLGIENAGKPGYYTVKPGDSLIRIGLDNGQNWRDLARWNQLDSPNRIEVGQVVRVIPPVAVNNAPAAVAVATPVPPLSFGVPSVPAVIPAVTPAIVPAAVPSTLPATTPVLAAKATATADDLNWIWPTTAGAVLAGFDDSKNKGLDIGGKLGDSVLAAADGRVVYAGAGLRGYGNLVILKHNDAFLSAYAHSQTILVKEDQTVTKGQKIAEMGQSDSDRVKLHFEIRRQGKPVDPALYLPKR
jgi:lipoprotein NlpD